MTFVDANYFVRYLTDRFGKQGRLARQLLLDAARGKIQLCSDAIVFFEIYWVMRGVYETKKADLQVLLTNLLSVDCIAWENKDILAAAVKLMSDLNYDLEDAFHLAWAKANDVNEVASFDQKLQKRWQVLS